MRVQNPYLFPHDISGLHDAARRQAVVSGQKDGLLQCHTQGAAVGQRGKTQGQAQTYDLPLHIHQILTKGMDAELSYEQITKQNIALVRAVFGI